MDILWAISNPPPAPPTAPKAPRLSHRSSTSLGSFHYDDIFPSTGPATPGGSLLGLSGGTLLNSVTSSSFAVPTPPLSDGTWDMYQDFVGGVQFWGYALASGSGDGAIRMWDSKCRLFGYTENLTELQCGRAKRIGHYTAIPRR